MAADFATFFARLAGKLGQMIVRVTMTHTGKQMSDRYSEFRDKLPRCYVEFIDSQNGWEGDLGDKLGYFVIWNRESIQEQWLANEMTLRLSDRWFPFGSDGGGEMLCFDLASGSDEVFWIPFIGMADQEAMIQSFSFADVAAAIRNAEK